MTGSIFQGATELNFGERDGSATVTFLRDGDLTGPVEVTYDVTTESATQGVDFLGSSGVVQFASGQASASVTFDLLDDAAGEETETFVVSLVAADGGALSVPRTCRINILDDETPILPPANPPLVSDYRVTTQPLVTGLSQPINIEFSPVDPDLVYVAEKAGQIRVFNVSTGADNGVFIDLREQVNSSGDRGLLDIVLHPDFQNQPHVYASYVVDPPGSAENGLLDKVGNRYMQVVRFTADAESDFQRVVPGSGVVVAGGAGTSLADISGNGVLDFTKPDHASAVSSERHLAPSDSTPPLVINGLKQDYIKVDSSSHAGGSLAFGPDGMLYISTGDGTSFNYADPHTVDVQNLNSLSGKILRVDPMTGKGLMDNPFYQDGHSLDSNISKVLQYGLRNPFSMAFDSLGQLFITDTGWNRYEEVNSGEAGANFGWPWYEGREGGRLSQTSGYAGFAEAAAFYEGVADGTIQVKPPYAAFAHAANPAGFQNQAIVGGGFVYSGERYPAELKDDYFFSNFPAGQIFTVDTRDRLEVDYLYTSPSGYAPVHYAQGPDGYVYYVDLGEYGTNSAKGGIGRLLISPVDPPQVSIEAAPTSVLEGVGATLTFSLNAAQAAPVTVTYSTANGTALAGSDFSGRANATVVIPAGQTSVSLALPIVDDAIVEANETFSVALNGATSGSAPIAIGGPATITILDNDVAPPSANLLVNGSFEATNVPAGGTAVLKTVPGWTALAGGRIELWNAYKGVTATDGTDLAELDYGGAYDGFYQDVPTTGGQAYDLSFDLRSRPGEPVWTQGLEVVWNGVVVATTTPGAAWSEFRVAVTGTSGVDRLTMREVSGQSGDGRGALIDDLRLTAASPAAAVSVAASASATEGTPGGATLTFSLNAAQAAPVTVTYSTANGTALAGSDFSGRANATVVIPAGQTSVSLALPIVDDAIVEANETFSVALNGATSGSAPIAIGGPATITILDNDVAPPSANLLVNGSFEATNVPAGGTAVLKTVPGWTALAGGRIELWNAYKGVTATDGTDLAELDYGGAYDGFYQDVPTTGGQAYDLSFDLRSRPGEPVWTQGLEVVWNGVVVATTTPGAAWSEFRVAVTGTSGVDRLTMREVSGQSGDGRGALIDDLRLTAASPAAAVSVAASASSSTLASTTVPGADSFIFSSRSESVLTTGPGAMHDPGQDPRLIDLRGPSESEHLAADDSVLDQVGSYADVMREVELLATNMRSISAGDGLL